ncbi:hypothetical protein ACOYW6_05395 [Parablastomonas sp. CN1-191]|uniref:hypothetical protein n=1 Tax=Parablastomonas sp. CN1-191 TaxID=3400908 RepID=UPI003BF77C9D
MKSYIAILAAAATALSPIAASSAFAFDATGDTTTTAENVCLADLASLGGGTLHDNTPVYSVVAGALTTQSVGAESEVGGTRVETPGTRVGVGTPTYSGLSIAGRPFRNGGSVNMFGDQVATDRTFSNSTYDFTADFSTVTTFGYSCNFSQATETHHDAVYTDGPVQGFYTNNGTNPSGGQGSCQGLSPANPHWGEDLGNCTWHYTGPGVPVLVTPESWTTDGTLTPRPDLATSHTIDQTDTVNHGGHELNGGIWTEHAGPNDRWLAAKVVVCISPKKLPGIWTQQNGYTGSDCNTTYFNSASWGGGSQTSNGTYISVPGV